MAFGGGCGSGPKRYRKVGCCLMKTSKALRGWRSFGTRAVAVLLTALLATQMVGTPAFASGEYATDSEQENTITNDVNDVTMDPAEGTTADESTEAEEATPQEEQQPADDSEEPQAAQEQSATDPADDGSTEGASSDSSDEVASVTLDLADTASITYGEETITDDANPIEVPANQELKFTASADEGFQIESVKTVIDGTETELTADDATGEYTVPADQVTDALTVKVEATEIPVEEATAEEEAPAAEEEQAVETEEVVADVSSPAFEGYAYVGDIVVKVTAGEGVLPEGTTVSAYQVDRQDVIDAVESYVEGDGETELKNSVAIDVTLIGPAGDVIQPEGAVNVCFFNTQLGDGDINVFRVADDASSVVEIGTRQAEAAVQSFDVDHFSIYVVGEDGTPALATYNFYDGETLVSSQVVKTDNTLYEPEVTELSGYKFTGWYTTEDAQGEPFKGFGQVTVSKTESISLYAHFEKAHYVFFMDGVDEDARVFRTEEGVEGEDVSTVGVEVPGLTLSQGVTGWYNNQGLTGESVAEVQIADENVYLWPDIREGHWITFDTDGGTYIEPMFVAAGTNSVAPDNPKRTGYAFAGWELGDEDFTFGKTIERDITVNAKWNRGTTSYTVMYWIENANNDEYSYLYSTTEWGTSGTQTSAEALTSNELRQILDSSTTGLTRDDVHLSDDHNAQNGQIAQETIAGDGTTIVNVYYDRDVDEVKFYSYQQTGTGWNGRPTYDWVEIDEYTISAKVGADISGRWPDQTQYVWYTSKNANEVQAWIGVMPTGGKSYYGRAGSGNTSASYYVEALDKSDPNGTYEYKNNVLYKLDHVDHIAYSGDVSNSDKYEMLGFTFRTYEPGRGYDNYNGAKFYYSRNAYEVHLVVGGKEQATPSLKYQEPLSELVDNATVKNPQRPDASLVPEDYVFAGWYDNPQGEGEPFDFAKTDETMPAHDMTFYAVWRAPEVKVTYYSDMNGMNPQDVENVKYGEAIHADQLGDPASIDGMQFVGWATRTGDEGSYTYSLFNFDTEIRSDVELYPYYISTGSYSVTYQAGEVT